MSVLEALLELVQHVSGTPYVVGGDSPAGTDCSGLASWTSNVAAGQPAFGNRFNTGNEESALLARGFQYGTAPDALVVGWNSYHTAVTLPDGTPVASGEPGGVRIGGGGAYQPQFTHHMFLPVGLEPPADEPAMGELVDMGIPAEMGDPFFGAPDMPADEPPPAEFAFPPEPEFAFPPEPAPADVPGDLPVEEPDAPAPPTAEEPV